jgi:hypothetical protein
VERNSFCSNMPVASTLNKESNEDRGTLFMTKGTFL